MDVVMTRFTELEIKWAISQLAGIGWVKIIGESIKLTDAGIDHCLNLEMHLGVENALMMQMFYDTLAAIASSMEQ